MARRPNKSVPVEKILPPTPKTLRIPNSEQELEEIINAAIRVDSTEWEALQNKGGVSYTINHRYLLDCLVAGHDVFVVGIPINSLHVAALREKRKLWTKQVAPGKYICRLYREGDKKNPFNGFLRESPKQRWLKMAVELFWRGQLVVENERECNQVARHLPQIACHEEALVLRYQVVKKFDDKSKRCLMALGEVSPDGSVSELKKGNLHNRLTKEERTVLNEIHAKCVAHQYKVAGGEERAPKVTWRVGQAEVQPKLIMQLVAYDLLVPVLKDRKGRKGRRRPKVGFPRVYKLSDRAQGFYGPSQSDPAREEKIVAYPYGKIFVRSGRRRIKPAALLELSPNDLGEARRMAIRRNRMGAPKLSRRIVSPPPILPIGSDEELPSE